jgi:hypothetical protein
MFSFAVDTDTLRAWELARVSLRFQSILHARGNLHGAIFFFMKRLHPKRTGCAARSCNKFGAAISASFSPFNAKEGY